MMSKKQWFVLLCLFIIYLLLGAAFFHQIETREEEKRRADEKIERKQIEVLLKVHYIPSINASQADIFERLSDYCGKPIHFNMSHTEEAHKWDFYHSLFFVITVVSTIGYGNLAPTTMLGRIFMIFYGLVGIPINGIVMVTLGDFFGTTYKKLYKKWKRTKMQDDLTRIGLIGQIILYLVPGFTFFIFIPAFIIMYFEGWAYDVAVYYAFVTLTTIGFGDYVAGVTDNEIGEVYFIAYKIFLLVWIIIGLGYIVMVLGFISRGMKSKQMHAFEQILAQNIRRTPNKLRELKTLVHELLLLRVKPIYKKHSIFVPMPTLGRSHSCPELSLYDNLNSPRVQRKRTLSEAFHTQRILPRVQSDTDLTLIDKDLTFQTIGAQERTKLLLKVSNVLSNMESAHSCQSLKGIDGFSSREILQSEKYPSQRTLSSQKSQVYPEIRIQNVDEHEKTWCGQEASIKQQELREKMKHGRARSRTLPVQQQPLIPIAQSRGLFGRIRKTFKRIDTSREKDIEKQEPIATPKTPKRNRAASECQEYLSRTRSGRASLLEAHNDQQIEAFTELLLALTKDDQKPKRKFGTASLTPPEVTPPRVRRQGIRINSRRASLNPLTPNQMRRFSLAPPEERLSPPPPYSPMGARPRRFSLRPVSSTTTTPSPVSPMETRPRRFSLRPVVNITTTPSPVQRQRMKSNKDAIKEGEPQ